MSDRADAIGGEFPVSCQEFVITEKPVKSAWPEYSGKKSLRCDSGRSAMLLALEHWQQNNGNYPDVWLPSYLCPSVPAVVRRAGLRVQYYQDGPGEVLAFSPPKPRDGDVVVIVHYFGHVNRRALDWLSGISPRKWGVVEDCVQSPYSAGVGVSGNYAITSLRKWWPAPDGATLHYPMGDWQPALFEPDEGFVSRRLLAKLLRPLGSAAEARHLALLAEAEARLDESAMPRKVSWVSESLLASADLNTMCERRQQNWLRLAASLSTINVQEKGLWCLNNTLAADAVPLAFPVRVDACQRDTLRMRLAALRIFCPVHWHASEHMDTAAIGLASSVLSLPVDQRYGESDMDAIIEAITGFFEGSYSD